ncbi:MAG: ISL3 family transposase [Deltaproteobacteria bacterium]|nr:ISL3 family transposase [Deltaproteobacteria bacterium]
MQNLTIPQDLEEICIDEVSWRSGHRYFTLVTDLKSHKLIWVVEGRTTQALDSFFTVLGKDYCARLKTVAIDMCEAYEVSIKKNCTVASIVYDRFHVVKMLNEAVNEVRKEEIDKAAAKKKKLLRNTKWLILTRESKLSTKQKNFLDELCAENKNIHKAVVFKELFMSIYQFPDPPLAEKHLIQCIVEAYQSGLAPLKKFAEFINRRKQGIMNWYFTKRTTSVSEGINNVVKTLRRSAYGYKNPNYFKLKILQKCGNLQILPI